MREAAFVPAVIWVAPFALLLLAIAVLPLFAAHFWESNLRKLELCAVLGLPVLGLYLAKHPEALVHTAFDYVSFIILLASLYVISGGVFLDGDLSGHSAGRTRPSWPEGRSSPPFVGTTGASMLLIRPLLQTNHERKHVTHTVIFFIFLVSNVGRLPDPARRSAPLPRLPGRACPSPGRCAWPFPGSSPSPFCSRSTTSGTRRPTRARAPRTAWKTGWPCGPCGSPARKTCRLLLGIVLAAAFLHAPWREVAMVALAAAVDARGRRRSCARPTTSPSSPSWRWPRVFAGIFVTMLPALDLLRARGAELGVREPWQFFWAGGAAVLLPRQRADLPDVPGPGPGARG